MADISGVVVLLAIGVVLDLIKKARDRQRQRAEEAAAPRPQPPVVVLPSGYSVPVPQPESRPLGLPEGWRRALEEAGPLGRSPDHALESDEEVEEGESLETEPEVVSLEVPVVRAPREVVDLDDESWAAVARRRREAALRDRALTRADHRAFDRKI
ncbi:MAG TPA: hypothetical protein VFY20_11180, partial [Gemmatimonadales bacterium]|nr:hypothetical protein [Gemmatimonadales bacterium]